MTPSLEQARRPAPDRSFDRSFDPLFDRPFDLPFDQPRTQAPPLGPAPRPALASSLEPHDGGLRAALDALDRRSSTTGGYAYLDEEAKREIRRGLLKAVAVPGHQTPFSGREMPMPYGWGTGGVQVTASLLVPDDALKVIDQGADDTVNAVSIRVFFARTARAKTTTRTSEATIIQTRHRIPETPLAPGQIMVYQVPLPEPLRRLEPRETETATLHALAEYGLMRLKLYEDVAKHGDIALSYDYPVLVGGRYLMSPSPIPSFDNPKLDRSPALHLFGAGREKRLYAVPPHTSVESLDFEDFPFKPQSWAQVCGLCGAADSYLDEAVLDDRGGRLFVCSDSDHCRRRRRTP